MVHGIECCCQVEYRQRYRHLFTIREQQIVVDLRDCSLCAVEATLCRLRLRHEVVAVYEDLESSLDDPLQQLK